MLRSVRPGNAAAIVVLLVGLVSVAVGLYRAGFLSSTASRSPAVPPANAENVTRSSSEELSTFDPAPTRETVSQVEDAVAKAVLLSLAKAGTESVAPPVRQAALARSAAGQVALVLAGDSGAFPGWLADCGATVRNPDGSVVSAEEQKSYFEIAADYYKWSRIRSQGIRTRTLEAGARGPAADEPRKPRKITTFTKRYGKVEQELFAESRKGAVLAARGVEVLIPIEYKHPNGPVAITIGMVYVWSESRSQWLPAILNLYYPEEIVTVHPPCL